MQTVSHTSMDVLLHTIDTIAATQVARAYVRRKIQKWQVRHATSCVTFSLWSLTQLLTKRTFYAHLTPR